MHKECIMQLSHESLLLRRALRADAGVSGAAGLLLAVGAGLLGSLLDLPAALVRDAGLVLLPYAAVVAYIGTRERMARVAVWAVIAANTLWAIDSIVLLVSGWVAPTALGYAFVIAQALVVAAFAELQYIGMRRAATIVA